MEQRHSNGNDAREAREAFHDQEEFEEIVVIGGDGSIYRPGNAPRSPGKKLTMIRDPFGEYQDTYR